MNPLRKAVRDYLAMRRSLGFKLAKHEVCLREFLLFLRQKRASHVSVNLALEWATRDLNHKPGEWASRLSIVRGFTRHWSATDALTEIPPLGLLPYRPQRARPYIYSQLEIQKLLKAAKNRPSIDPLRPWTYYCLFGLLAVAGLRISEALNLQTGDMDWSEGILTINKTKFGKSRLVPLHASTCKVLADYVKRRNRRFGARSDGPFLLNKNGNHLDKGEVHRTFYSLSHEIGLRAVGASRGPRLHDFRHRFAVETLLRWYRAGEDPKRRLPVLSTYLGHAHVTDTYWYLTGTPELLGAAAQRMEKRWEGLMRNLANLAALLQSFFTVRLITQRKVSAHTIASYRDTFRLLLQFAQQRLHKAPSQLGLSDLNASLIGEFWSI